MVRFDRGTYSVCRILVLPLSAAIRGSGSNPIKMRRQWDFRPIADQCDNNKNNIQDVVVVVVVE